MLKIIARPLIALLVTVAVNANALPIIEADAFTVGDNKAVLDTTTGLTWLDFGINRAESFNSVMSQLDTTYVGWRLPTESEVRSLWTKLFIDLSIDNSYEIFNVWGANKTPGDNLPFLCWGYFIDDNGYLGHGSILETGTIVNAHGADKYYEDGTIVSGVAGGAGKKYDGSSYPLFNLSGTQEISTLLVRDIATNSANVPEPSEIILFSLGIFGLLLGRRRKIG